MSKYFDQGDVRLPEVFPRLAERYATPPLPATWFAPSRRKALTGKAGAVPVRIVEVSMSGLMVEAPANKRVTIGAKIRVEFNNADVIVEVCNIRQHDHPDRSKEQIYGVAFFRASDEFDMLISQIVYKLQQLDRVRNGLGPSRM